MKTANFKISGMHCASCSFKNETSLSKIPGVTKATVNFATGAAAVEYDETKSDEHALHEAVIKNGYKVVSQEHAGSHEHKMESQRELAASKMRAYAALGLSVPALVIAMAGIELPYEFAGQNGAIWIQAVLSSIVILVLGREFHIGLFKQLRHFSANMDTLISLGTLAALFFSFWVMATGGKDFYFETGAIITAFILLGRYFEAASRGRASEAIEKLMELGAKTARRMRDEGSASGPPEARRGIRDEEFEEIPIEQVKVGDLLLIKPGEKIPVDAVIVKGAGGIDESMLTGESMPVRKKEGDKIFGATINLDSALIVKTEQVGEGTLLAQIVKMVADAQTSKAPIQKLADRISGIFVPVVILIAAAVAALWYWQTGNITQSFVPAVAVLVIACPCALGLATPTAIMVGTGLGAKRGILIKSGESLERVRKIDSVVFDKTGTLTEGKPKVEDVEWDQGSGIRDENLLILAASVENFSEHPIAAAVVTAAKEKNLALKQVENFENLAGRGVKGKIDGKEVFVGSQRLMKDHGIETATLQKSFEKLEGKAKTVIFVGFAGKLAGIIAVADTEKVDAREAIQKLSSQGKEVILLTGDNQKTAAAIAAKLGIQKFFAEVLPQDKAEKIKLLQSEGKSVAFVGDGINDAPALVQSDLGIAMGTGTDIAIEAGNIVLVKGSPMKVVEALTLSRATLRIIKQNLFWAFFYNVAAIPLAGLGLLNPMIAAGAMAFSSVSVVLNSLRLQRAI